MKKIALIPIDNRPVCYQLPQQIVSLSDEYKLFLPDRELMGGLVKSADCDSVLNWLDSLKEIDIIVISLDTIAYGGLIPSRRTNDSFEVIKNKVLKLADILQKNNAKVFAFSSIMRISNNNNNEEEKEYWKDYGKKIFEYSVNLHKTGCKNSNIPQNILDDYLETRKRNFQINKLYIDLKKQGIFDTLVFSKDDCSQYGLNVMEAHELEQLSKNIKNVYIKTGADEIPLVLLSRALNSNKHIKIHPVYTNPDSINKISKYEDISVEESVKSQIELSGGIIADKDNADLILLVNNFKHQQGELVMDIHEPLYKKDINIPDKPYFIADILNANGSDNSFINTLLKNDNLKEFYGYSAWNTTGNTLGSAIASALTYYGAKIPNKHAFCMLQLTRFLDDWAYQANVRGHIRNNPENLSQTVLKAKMDHYEKFLLKKFGVTDYQINYSFPWKRFFEIEISIQKVYFKIPFIDILFYE